MKIVRNYKRRAKFESHLFAVSVSKNKPKHCFLCGQHWNMDVLAWLFNFWVGLLLIDHCDLSSRHDLQNNQVWHSRGLIDSSNNQATLARIHAQGLTLNQNHIILLVKENLHLFSVLCVCILVHGKKLHCVKFPLAWQRR